MLLFAKVNIQHSDLNLVSFGQRAQTGHAMNHLLKY